MSNQWPLVATQRCPLRESCSARCWAPRFIACHCIVSIRFYKRSEVFIVDSLDKNSLPWEFRKHRPKHRNLCGFQTFVCLPNKIVDSHHQTLPNPTLSTNIKPNVSVQLISTLKPDQTAKPQKLLQLQLKQFSDASPDALRRPGHFVSLCIYGGADLVASPASRHESPSQANVFLLQLSKQLALSQVIPALRNVLPIRINRQSDHVWILHSFEAFRNRAQNISMWHDWIQWPTWLQLHKQEVRFEGLLDTKNSTLPLWKLH